MGKQNFADFLGQVLKGKRICIDKPLTPPEGIVEDVWAQGGIDEEELCIKFENQEFPVDCSMSTTFEIKDE